MRASVLVSGLLVAAASLTAGLARAEGGEGGYPISYVERPPRFPKMTLAPQLEIDITRTGFAGLTTLGSTNSVVAGMQIGATFGILDNLEVGAIVLPIQFNNPGGYGAGIFGFRGEEGDLANLRFFGTFRFLNAHPIELGARLRLDIVTPNGGLGAGAVIEPSVPLLLHIGKIGRLDVEVGIPIRVIPGISVTTGIGTVSTGSKVAGGLDVPIRLAFDIIEPFHIGVNTGLVIEDFGDAGGSTGIPLGVFFGYAIGSKGRPIVDIDPFFNFYDFITPGGGPLGDKANPGLFTTGIAARGYIYL